MKLKKDTLLTTLVNDVLISVKKIIIQVYLTCFKLIKIIF